MSVRSHAQRAVIGDDPVARVLATWGMARAELDLGRLDSAREAARRALELVDGHTPDDARRAVVMSAAVIIAESGDIDEGLQALDSLRAGGSPVDRGRVEVQQAYILHQAGRLNEAVSHLDMAERLLGSSAEPRDRIRLHQNRGLVLLQQGRFSDAESDFVASEQVAQEAHLSAARALSIASRAVLFGRARRLADSVRCFSEAAAVLAEAGSPARLVALTEIDRAEVMMHSGLVLDAVVAARSAVGRVEPTGNRMLVGDARLLVARAELSAGLVNDARRSADSAAELFEATGRRDMVAQARSVGAHARLRSVRSAADVPRELDDTGALIAQLDAHGWQRQADDVRYERVRLAARLGTLESVAADVEHLRRQAESAQRDLALMGLMVDALAVRDGGALEGALAVCRRGFDQLDVIVNETRSLEERSAVIRLGADLSQLAIEIAVDLGDADIVLAAAEGTRARALHDELAGSGRHQALTDDGAAMLRSELGGRLGERTLVEWVVARERVMAVVFGVGGARLVDVAAVADVVRARDRLLAHLDVATSDPDGSSVRARRAASLLDELLLAPLGLGSGGGIVMVPVDVLHGVPWSGLPSLAGRSFVLTPNAQIWLAADRRSGSAIRSVGVVVGPDVEGGLQEREAAIARHPGAAVAAGAGASSATVSSMLARYGLVHIAAHGSFRSDRPLLSTLRLADGEATLHDVVPDRVESRVVILSSCEGGAQGISDGSEVLGLGAVLLARGAASVLAPLTAVRDLECADFVSDVHAELAAGEPLACAVSNVRQRWLDDDDLSRWAVASSFSCFGSGASTIAT